MAAKPAFESGESGIQHDWGRNATFCWKPPANWAIPYMCIVSQDRMNFTKNQNIFSMYESCCPPIQNGSNIWQVRRGCAPACYTHDVTLALGFAACVGNISEANYGPVNRTNKPDGSCQIIDYTYINTPYEQRSGVTIGRDFVGVWTVALLAVLISCLGISGV